jgi:hypothetical protein
VDEKKTGRQQAQQINSRNCFAKLKTGYHFSGCSDRINFFAKILFYSKITMLDIIGIIAVLTVLGLSLLITRIATTALILTVLS